MKLASEKNLRQLRAIRLRFLRNRRGFLVRYRLAIAACIVTGTLDYFSTVFFMILVGPHREGHPWIRLLAIHLGIWIGPLVGKVGFFALGLVATIYVRKWAGLILWSAAILYLYASWHNLYMMGFFDRGP